MKAGGGKNLPMHNKNTLSLLPFTIPSLINLILYGEEGEEDYAPSIPGVLGPWRQRVPKSMFLKTNNNVNVTIPFVF